MKRKAGEIFQGRQAAVAMPRRRPGAAGRGRGFTLVEVLATLVLLAIVLPVTVRGVSLALAAASNARHTSEAAVLAEAKLNQLIAEGQGTVVTSSGDFAPEHADYRWICQSAERDYSVNEVLVRVTWNERGQEHSLAVSTLAYDNPSGSSITGAP